MFDIVREHEVCREDCSPEAKSNHPHEKDSTLVRENGPLPIALAARLPLLVGGIFSVLAVVALVIVADNEQAVGQSNARVAPVGQELKESVT
jgi:hypothetical protein